MVNEGDFQVFAQELKLDLDPSAVRLLRILSDNFCQPP